MNSEINTYPKAQQQCWTRI